MKNNSTSSNPYYTVVEDYDSDAGVEQLLLLGLSHTNTETTHKRTNWIYKNNPAGLAVICKLHHCESEEAIGLVAICRRQIWTKSGIANAGMFCDLVIEKSHRTLGPAIKLMERAIVSADEAKLDRVYGWPSERSLALFKRLPNAKINSVNIYRRYFDWETELSLRIPKPAARLLGGCFQLVDNCMDRVRGFIFSRSYIAKELQTFTPEFDELWVRARERYDQIGVRDARFLNWRFTTDAEYQHDIFAIYKRNENRVVGYVVHRQAESDLIEICDFLAEDSGLGERSLFNAFSSHFRSNSHLKLSLTFTGNKQTIRNLWLAGFIRVGSRVANQRQPDNSLLSSTPTRTHVTQADQDVG